MSNAALFTGLLAFPPTPADAQGVVDAKGLARLIDRLAASDVDAIAILGSTGTYAYLEPAQRNRAVAASVEAVDGRKPLIVGVGAMRTSWVCELAVAAEAGGADGLLMAPMSYTPLTQDEVARHACTVAGVTSLPLCLYNNPGTTNFRFGDDLIAELAGAPNIAAIKMPLVQDGDFAGELARLRARTPADFRIGYSGDWGCAAALLAGADGWFSVVAGLLPDPTVKLARAAQSGDTVGVAAIQSAFAPLWTLFQQHGSLRLAYEIADRLGLAIGSPPAPIQRVAPGVAAELERALESLSGL